MRTLKPGMAYVVRIMPRAERDLSILHKRIDAYHSRAAVEWYRGLKRAVLSLESSPNRCPVTPESRKLRHLLYGHRRDVYRVIYRVLEKKEEVQVIHIRHGARGAILWWPLSPKPSSKPL